MWATTYSLFVYSLASVYAAVCVCVIKRFPATQCFYLKLRDTDVVWMFNKKTTHELWNSDDWRFKDEMDITVFVPEAESV